MPLWASPGRGIAQLMKLLRNRDGSSSVILVSLTSLLSCQPIWFGRGGVAQLAHQAKIPLPDVKFNSHQSPIAGESL
jgi:hypothetical protein